jgi:hypothetical protein
MGYNRAADIGKMRAQVHGNRNKEQYEYDTIGAAGEIAFGAMIGQRIDEALKVEGDGGVDFLVNLVGDDGEIKEYVIDVKTFKNPYNLIVDEGKIDMQADRRLIYVLMDYNGGRPIALGWQWRSVLKKCNRKDFGKGHVNYYQHVTHLRHMHELITRVV